MLDHPNKMFRIPLCDRPIILKKQDKEKGEKKEPTVDCLFRPIQCGFFLQQSTGKKITIFPEILDALLLLVPSKELFCRKRTYSFSLFSQYI